MDPNAGRRNQSNTQPRTRPGAQWINPHDEEDNEKIVSPSFTAPSRGAGRGRSQQMSKSSNKNNMNVSFRAEMLPDSHHPSEEMLVPGTATAVASSSSSRRDYKNKSIKGDPEGGGGPTLQKSMSKRSKFQKESRTTGTVSSFAQMAPDTLPPASRSMRQVDHMMAAAKEGERLERARLRNTLQDARKFRRTQHVAGVDMSDQLPDVSPTSQNYYEPSNNSNGGGSGGYTVQSNFADPTAAASESNTTTTTKAHHQHLKGSRTSRDSRQEKASTKTTRRSRNHERQSGSGGEMITVGTPSGHLRKLGRRRKDRNRGEEEEEQEVVVDETTQHLRELYRSQQEAGFDASLEDIMPGAWRLDDGEQAEHLAPHPRLGHMLGSSASEFNNSSGNILYNMSSSSLANFAAQQQQSQHSGEAFDSEPDAEAIGVTTADLRKKRPRWLCRVLAFAIVLIVAIIVAVAVVVSRKSSSPTASSSSSVGGNNITTTVGETTPPSSSPSQDPILYETEWVKQGQVLRGRQENDQFGRTLAMSSGGSIVAASTENNDDGSNDYVQVYQLNNTEWVQLGSDFETADQAYVDLAKNGTVVSIATIGREDNSTRGSVQLFEWRSSSGTSSSSSWVQLGDTIMAEASSSRYFGYETKVSEDGLVVLVGDPGVGRVIVYTMLPGSSNWTQIGEALPSSITGDFHRSTLSISDNGTVVAIGNWDNEKEKPFVRVYEQEQDLASWRQRGNVIDADTMMGTNSQHTDKGQNRLSVSLSSDGSSLAVGDRFFNHIETEGLVRVFRYEKNKWVRVGKEVTGNRQSGYFGTSISLSADGSTFVSGFPMRMPRESTRSKGATEVYHLSNNGEWIVVGKMLAANVSFGAAFGSYVSLAADGMTVAVADQYDEYNGARSGSVTVFRLAPTQ